MISRLKTIYDKEIVSKLMSKLNYKNKHQVPKFKKIVLNMGLGDDASDGKKIKICLDDMTLITGQKAIVTKFKKSIANFKTRKGSNAGVKTTLRASKMYDFIDRLINIAYKKASKYYDYYALLTILLISIFLIRSIIDSNMRDHIFQNLMLILGITFSLMLYGKEHKNS